MSTENIELCILFIGILLLIIRKCIKGHRTEISDFDDMLCLIIFIIFLLGIPLLIANVFINLEKMDIELLDEF